MSIILWFWLNLFQPVYVEWVDITASDSGWHSTEELLEWESEVNVVKQVGFLYKDTPTYIILIDSYFDSETLGSATKIPKCNIIRYENLPKLRKHN